MIIRSKAPLRLGLCGGGTDVSPYCDKFGGVVLNTTINMYAYCTIEPTNNNLITFIAPDMNMIFKCKSTPNIKLNSELCLHKQIYNRIVKDYNKNKPLSFKMTTYSDAPAGSGLGSSSTMVVAIIKSYVEWLNIPLGDYEIAYLAYEIERLDLKLTGGKQDQFATTFGGFNLMEFYNNNRVIVNPLNIKNEIKNELESSLILYYTGVSRKSAKIIDEQINNTNLNVKKSIEGMHKLKETTFKMKNALLKGHINEFTNYLNKSWTYKKQMASGITNVFINDIYDFAINNGAKAAKISGAGGGGFMMIICNPNYRYDLIKKLNQKEGTVMLVQFTQKGAESWTIKKQNISKRGEN